MEAADMVGLSRPYVAARVDAGDIPLFDELGGRRRVLASNVRAWYAQYQLGQRQAMSELADDMVDDHDSKAE
jgi:hypothetical protein